MSRIHRGQGEAWLRGGQTVSHTWDMVLEVLGRIMIVVIIWAALCIWLGNSKSSELEQAYGIQALQAATFDKVGYPFPQEISIRGLDGRDRTYSNEAVAEMEWIQPYARSYFHNQKVAASQERLACGSRLRCSKRDSRSVKLVVRSLSGWEARARGMRRRATGRHWRVFWNIILQVVRKVTERS